MGHAEMIPELTIRHMVEVPEGTLEVETSELMTGERMSEVTLRLLVPREQEGEAVNCIRYVRSEN